MAGLGSGIAEDVGFVAIAGDGSAATRVISWFHWAALIAFVVTSGTVAVGPDFAEWAAVVIVADGAGAAKSSWIRFQ